MRRALRRLRHHVWVRVHRAEQRHAERLELHDLPVPAPRVLHGNPDDTATTREWGPCG